MNRSSALKLSLTILVINTAVAFLALFSYNAILLEGFKRFVNQQDLRRLEPVAVFLEREYAKRSNWAFLQGDPGKVRWWIADVVEFGVARPPRNVDPEASGPPFRRRAPDHRGLLFRMVVSDPDGKALFAPGNLPAGPVGRPLKEGDKTVGYLSVSPLPEDLSPFDRRFLADCSSQLAVLALLLALLPSALTYLYLKKFLSPLHNLSEASLALSQGDHSVRVEIPANEDLGRLASSINSLAASLKRSDESHKQWMADSSHELRTPIAVLRAQVEALQDGVQSADSRTLGILHSEIMSLNKIVNQLYDLARSDMDKLSYRLAPVDPCEILIEATEAFEERFKDAGIELKVNFDAGLQKSPVLADADHLKQLFTNLLENSLRYTDRGGCLAVSNLVEGKSMVALRFDDSAPAVPADKLDKIFERFFRVDSSRSRLQGGTGLGLAICKKIAEGHGGRIEAGASPLGGLRVEVWLPIRKEASQ
ncbi:MAG: ATP-binding protein [Candidatus Obscuribacterales bacterium]